MGKRLESVPAYPPTFFAAILHAMRTDLYTKIVLTAIAGLLAVTVFLSASPQTVKAQGNDYWIRPVRADQNGQLKVIVDSKNNALGPLPGNLLSFSCYDAGQCYAVGK